MAVLQTFVLLQVPSLEEVPVKTSDLPVCCIKTNMWEAALSAHCVGKALSLKSKTMKAKQKVEKLLRL